MDLARIGFAEWKDSSRCRSLGGCGGDGAYLDHFVRGRSRLGSDPAYVGRFGSSTPEISEQD